MSHGYQVVEGKITNRFQGVVGYIQSGRLYYCFLLRDSESFSSPAVGDNNSTIEDKGGVIWGRHDIEGKLSALVG